MLLYIIRHGDPIYDPDSLTEKGKLQAAALARRLSVHGLDRVYCSPLIRARQTAQPTCELLGLTPVIEEWTSEALAWQDLAVPSGNHGRTWAFHNVPNTKLKSEENMLLTRDDWYKADFLADSNAEAGYKRISDASDEFTERLGYKREGAVYRIIKPSDERVAVFCHQGFGTTWLSYLLAIPPHIFWSSFDLTHSSVTILRFANGSDGYTAPMCLTLSDTSHIYADRLPMKYNNHIDI